MIGLLLRKKRSLPASRLEKEKMKKLDMFTLVDWVTQNPLKFFGIGLAISALSVVGLLVLIKVLFF